jgi:hypothetical protein
MAKLTRLAALTVAFGALVAIGPAAVGAKPARKGRSDSGVVYFAITHNASGHLYAAGSSTDRLFGSGAVTYVIQTTRTPTGGFEMKSKPVMLFFSNGTLTGTATATVTPRAGGTTLSDGRLAVANGTGGQKGHSLKATFEGTGSPVTGEYRITYTGVYR